MLYKFLGKKGAFYQLDLEPINIKLNYNCPDDYKNGEGEGSCKGYKPGSEALDSKKTTEKKASIVKPVTKSTVKQPTFNPVDIVNRIRTGGKISKEEYDYILPLINKANQPANSSTSTKTQPKTTEEKSKSLPAKKKDIAETHPGLTKLQSDIKKVGGADKFFDKLKIPDGSDTSLHSVSVKELNSNYPPEFKSTPFATYGNITLHYGKENPKDIIAVSGKKVVGYVMDDSNEEEGLFSVAAVVANEFRGQNLGSKLLYNFYDKNPDKIGKAGSLTPDGKKAFKRVLKGIEDGSFKKVLETDTKQLPAKQEKITVSKQPPNVKAGSGLDKIRSEIKKAGGAEKFFKTTDTHAKDQEERKPIDSEKMARIVNLYTESDTFKKPYKEENGVKWYEAKKDGNSIVIAKVGKKIAAYGLKATDPDDPKNPYTTIVASTDFTGKGYGKQAMLEFYDKNPDMIKKTGGLTPMGKKAYLKTLKTIAGE